MLRKHSNWLLAITLGLFCLNFTPVLAQVMEINVVGGGYRLRGPNEITFDTVPASFVSVDSTKDIRTLHAQDEESPAVTQAFDFVVIEDQNGGNAFQVTVTATNLLDAGSGLSIPNSNFFIKNSDGGDVSDDIIPDNALTTEAGVALHSTTNNFTDLSTQRVLFTSDGQAPGAWRVYPVFKITVPAEQPPGNYESTLTFTVI